MVFHGPRLVFHGFRSVLMVFHGPRLVFHGSRLVFSCFQVGFYGFSWFQVGFYGSRMVFIVFIVPGWFFMIPGRFS